MIFHENEVLSIDTLNYDYKMSDLTPAKIKVLKLCICESGNANQSDTSDVYNIAVGFISSSSIIQKVVASEGTYWYRCNFMGFEEYSERDGVILRYMNAYEYGDDGMIIYSTVDIVETGIYKYFGA